MNFGTHYRETTCEGQPEFERCAKTALRTLWDMRTPLGLFGTALDMRQSMWLDNNGGIGASADSFYEYLLKAYILFGGGPQYKPSLQIGKQNDSCSARQLQDTLDLPHLCWAS